MKVKVFGKGEGQMKRYKKGRKIQTQPQLGKIARVREAKKKKNCNKVQTAPILEEIKKKLKGTLHKQNQKQEGQSLIKILSRNWFFRY